MTDYPKCTFPPRSQRHRRVFAAVILQANPQARPDYQPPTPTPPPLQVQAKQPTGYNIRIAERPGRACKFCRLPTGAGAVGHFFDEPICDRCCAENCVDLGMVLALIDIARTYVHALDERPDEAGSAIERINVFLRVFESVVSHWGPPRSFDSIANGVS